MYNFRSHLCAFHGAVRHFESLMHDKFSSGICYIYGYVEVFMVMLKLHGIKKH